MGELTESTSCKQEPRRSAHAQMTSNQDSIDVFEDISCEEYSRVPGYTRYGGDSRHQHHFAVIQSSRAGQNFLPLFIYLLFTYCYIFTFRFCF